jgi:hypothetical protein
MAMGSTQLLGEMGTRNFLGEWGEVRCPVLEADNIETFTCQISENPGNLNLLQSTGSI